MASVKDEHLLNKYSKALLSLSRVMDDNDKLLAKYEGIYFAKFHFRLSCFGKLVTIKPSKYHTTYELARF